MLHPMETTISGASVWFLRVQNDQKYVKLEDNSVRSNITFYVNSMSIIIGYTVHQS